MTFSPLAPRGADDLPEVNFANVNARGVLDLLGIHDEYPCGQVEHDDLAVLRRRIVTVLNLPAARRHLVEEPYELEPGHAGVVVVSGVGAPDGGVPRIERRGCRAVYFGNTDQQTVRRLRALDEVVRWAQEHGVGVSWG